MRCAGKDSDRLDTAFRNAVGVQGTVRHLVPMIQIEILDLDLTTEDAEVKEAVRN